MGLRRFTDLRAWHACVAFKRAIYALCQTGALAADRPLADQLRQAAAGPPAHLAEGFGRFNPLDFARFAGIARSSLMESQNHLRDAVDRGHLSEDAFHEYDQLANAALQEVTGLLQYLMTPEATQKARRARERAIAKAEGKRRGQAD